MLQLDKGGAFLRISPQHFRIWEGPWTEATQEPDLVVADFFAESLRSLKATRRQDCTLQEWRQICESRLSSPQNFKSVQLSEPSFENFRQSFQSIQGKIQRGEIEKAVPIVFSETSQVPLDGDLGAWGLTLSQAPPELWTFGFWEGNRGIVGASPEILFRRQAMTLMTMALAGTTNRAESPEEFLRNPKERREHDLVVNDLVSRLKPLGWLKKSDLEILQLPHLQHFKTKLEISGCAKREAELIKYLHPTPALGVAPRAYGYQWMRELPEQKNRELFGAPLAFSVGPDDYVAVVAIRSLMWSKTSTRLGTGCGIVENSQLEKEWDEILLKRKAVLASFGLS